MKFGTNVDPIKKIFHTKLWMILLVSSYDHSKFLLENLQYFVYIKMVIILCVIDIDTFGLKF